MATDDGIRSEDLGYGDDDDARRNPGLAASGAGTTTGATATTSAADPTGTGMDVTDASEAPIDELPEGAQTPSTRTTNNTSGGPEEP